VLRYDGATGRSMLKDLRWSVKQLAAQHGLPVPESRFSRFLDADLDE
jgi:hypothetical protein